MTIRVCDVTFDQWSYCCKRSCSSASWTAVLLQDIVTQIRWKPSIHFPLYLLQERLIANTIIMSMIGRLLIRLFGPRWETVISFPSCIQAHRQSAVSHRKHNDSGYELMSMSKTSSRSLSFNAFSNVFACSGNPRTNRSSACSCTACAG